jgi:hypothetical protein
MFRSISCKEFDRKIEEQLLAEEYKETRLGKKQLRELAILYKVNNSEQEVTDIVGELGGQIIWIKYVEGAEVFTRAYKVDYLVDFMNMGRFEGSKVKKVEWIIGRDQKELNMLDKMLEETERYWGVDIWDCAVRSYNTKYWIVIKQDDIIIDELLVCSVAHRTIVMSSFGEGDSMFAEDKDAEFLKLLDQQS